MYNREIEKLIEERKICSGCKVVLWGIGAHTSAVLSSLQEYGIEIVAIIDNFKDTFTIEYEGVTVYRAKEFFDCERLNETETTTVILAINYADEVVKQLLALGVTKIYNLREPYKEYSIEKCDINYSFVNRSKGHEALCYILAGYEQTIWDGTLARVEKYQSEKYDYCLVSSGKYDEQLADMAEQNGWSYLSTEVNQVCYIQNLVVELHPKAEYILKMDEDIFVGEEFFDRMLSDFKRVEIEGDYRVGFAVPVVPLNCAGYVSYLKLSGNRENYESKFGRAYISRFSAVFNVVETAEFLWDTMTTFDDMSEKFHENYGYGILSCYYNIGVIMFTRDRWIMMGKWPEDICSSGMGVDEAYICQDGNEKDMPIYEFYDVLAGHLAFGHQKKVMLEYYSKNKTKFVPA